jgi:hypothetical protein
VATGKAGAPTDLGTFLVFWKDLHHGSSDFNNCSDAIFRCSSTVMKPSRRATSPSGPNGCVRLAHRAAQDFYKTLHVGDVVQVVR